MSEHFVDWVSQFRQGIIDGVVEALTNPRNGPLTEIQRDIRTLLINQAVTDNRTKGEGLVTPYTIVPDINGNLPRIQIRNFQDLNNLNGVETRTLCAFYGIHPIPQIIDERKRAIARVCGINVAM
jgi:hypothetical protein